MQKHIFSYAFFILFLHRHWLPKKRDVTSTNRADLHTATTLSIRVIKLQGPTVSEDRERRHAV
jgi:hypothetical protein